MTKVTRLTINEGQTESRRIHLREISGDVDAPLETVGQDLRAGRLRKGDDLGMVSRALKIRREHLEALEEDRFESLPGRTYAVGFVRSYAEFLGLDVPQLVERFKAEIAGRNEITTPQVHVIDEERKLPRGWIVIAAVVGVMLLYGAYHLIVSTDDLLNQPVTPAPPQAVAQKPAVRKPVATPLLADEGTTTLMRGADGTSAQQPADRTLVPGGGVTVRSLAPVAANPTKEVFGVQNHAPRVVLRVRYVTQILVQGPDKAVFINRTLKPGDLYQVPNVPGLTLTTPNGGAVEIDLDGAPMGYAGRKNETAEALSLDPQAIVDRYNGGGG